MSDEFGARGYETAELAAIGDIPARYCSVIASEASGDDAYVLLNTGSTESPYPYGVHCVRENGLWYEADGSNGSSWALTDEESDRGILAYWDEAPAGADAASVRFDGKDYEVPVTQGHFLLVLWDTPGGTWPQLRGFRVDGKWDTRSDGELRRERRMSERVERHLEPLLERIESGAESPSGMSRLDEEK